MKKIALGLASIAMAASMFAAAPAFNPTSSISGNASVTWGVDLDSGKTGFANSAETTVDLNLWDDGSRETEKNGDIWAELKVSGKAGKAEVDVAMFHIYDMYVGIKAGDTQVGGCNPQAAIRSGKPGIGAVGANKEAGIVVGYANDYFGIDVDFRSTKADPKYTNEYAVAAEASLKAVENLDLKAGVAYDFVSSDVAYAASASYKIAMGDNYLKPTVGYTSGNKLTAGVIYAWGDEADADAGVYFLSGDEPTEKAWRKVTPGVSVVYTNTGFSGAGDIEAAVYFGSLVDNLKFAAWASMGLDNVADSTKVRAGCAYDIKADDVTITPKAGASYAKDSLLIKAGVDFGGLINNTTFSVEYASRNLLGTGDKAGTLDFTAKIAF